MQGKVVGGARGRGDGMWKGWKWRDCITVVIYDFKNFVMVNCVLVI